MRIETEIASIALFPEISPPPPLDTNVPQRVRRLCAQRNPEQLCGMSGKVTLQPQSAKRALFLGITGVQAPVSEQCLSQLFPAGESFWNLEVPIFDRVQALGRSSRNKTLGKLAVWAPRAHDPPSAQCCHPPPKVPQ